jgi:tetratricopeptide (TPR) repeat protein
MGFSEKGKRHFLQTGKRYADYFLRYAKGHQRDWQELKAEHANLFLTAKYYRDACEYVSLLALREVLQTYLDLQGHWNHSLVLNEWTISLAQVQADWINAARFTHDRADMLNQKGDYREAEKLYQSSEEDFLRLGQEESALKSRHMRSMVVRAQGRLDEAQALCEATIDRGQELGLSHWLPHPLYVRALLARDRGDYLRAKKWIDEGLCNLDVNEEPAMVAQCHHFLGELALLQGQRANARSHLETSLRLSQQVGILRRVAATQRLLGDLAQAENQFEEAEKFYRDSLALASKLSDRPQEARTLVSYALMLAPRGRSQEAIGELQRARAIYQMVNDPRGFVGASLSSARIALKLGRCRMAVRFAWDAIRTAWTSRLLRPGILIGMIRRRIR